MNALAIGLAADTSESGKKALEVVRAKSPELPRLSEQTGEDLLVTSANFIEVLLLSLRSDIEPPWSHFEQQAREQGRLRAAQGVPIQALQRPVPPQFFDWCQKLLRRHSQLP